MDSPTTLHATLFTNAEEYIAEGNQLISAILLEELTLFGITKSELKSRNTVLLYQIGKHTSRQPDEIQEIYSALGITLVEATWLPNKLIVSTPRAHINYAETTKWIKEDMSHVLTKYREPPFTDDLDPTAQH